MKQIISQKTLTGERAAYASRNVRFVNCLFENGESPLKECRSIAVDCCTFAYKYPLWYCRDVEVCNTQWQKEARSGVWYTHNISLVNCSVDAPKQFRRCSSVKIQKCNFPIAEETLWHCCDVEISDAQICGDYFGMNCKDVHMRNVKIDGNYCFDGGENIVAENCIFNSKDAFWNCKNVFLKNCTLDGEFLAWNTQNLVMENCTIRSHQGMCYIHGLKLLGCSIFESDLIFELCTEVFAQVTTTVDSIKNPLSGVIRVKDVGQLILDEKVVDTTKIRVEIDSD